VRIADLKQIEAVLSGHRGTGVVINFWAIWCEPCVAEMPELVEVARAYRGRAAVLTVSYDLMVPDVTGDDVLKTMREFVAACGIDLPVLIYDGPDYDAINARFGLPGPVPVTIAIDRNGKVVERHAGKAGKAVFTELVEKAIGR
jgi:thiol-disulfide isomerase/thioredoxin